jgi:hypothetical protein
MVATESNDWCCCCRILLERSGRVGLFVVAVCQLSAWISKSPPDGNPPPITGEPPPLHGSASRVLLSSVASPSSTTKAPPFGIVVRLLSVCTDAKMFACQDLDLEPKAVIDPALPRCSKAFNFLASSLHDSIRALKRPSATCKSTGQGNSCPPGEELVVERFPRSTISDA